MGASSTPSRSCWPSSTTVSASIIAAQIDAGAPAAAAWDRDVDFRDALRVSERLRATLSDVELDALFEPRLGHLEGVFARLEKLEVNG